MTESQSEKKFFGVRIPVVFLGLAAALNDISSDMIYPLLPIFLTSTVGATPLIVGMIEGVADALSSFLKLIAGSLSDRFPRRKPFVVGGYGLAAVSRVLIAIAWHWPLIFTARLLDRTGKGIRSAPRDALICDVTPEPERGRAFGLHRAFDHSGAVAGPLLAGVLLTFEGMTMRHVFWIAVIPAVMGAIMLAFVLREKHRDVSEAKNRHASGHKVPLPKRFWPPMASIALFYLANSSDAFLILQAHAAGVATATIPFLWAAHHVIKTLFSTQAGGLSDRTDRRYLLIAGWFVYALIYVIFPFSKSLWLFLLLFILYAIPFTLTEGAERAWVASFLGPAERGRGFGVYYLVVGIFTLGGTLIFGLLYQMVSPFAAFWTGAALSLIAATSVALQARRV